MKTFSITRCVVWSLVCGRLIFLNLSADPGEPVSGNHDIANGAKEAVGQASDFHTDPFSGRFIYSVPIFVSPARQGAEPKITLVYNSSGNNDWCGVGWDLDMGSIQRDTSKGVPVNGAGTYDDAKGFTFGLGGASSKLVNVGGTEYRAEVEGAFLKFVLSANSWQVTDKSGTIYYFNTMSIKLRRLKSFRKS